MRSTRVLIAIVAFVLGAAMCAVPLQVADAQALSTTVLVPSNGATVSGTGVVLDASASSGVTQVQFELTGGSLIDSVIATAVVTYYGWIAKWNSTTVADGTYTLQSLATEDGSSATSSGISVKVSNGAPSVSIVLPSAGSTLSGSQWLDATASPGVTTVGFAAVTGTPGVCPEGPGPGGFCSIGDATPTEYGWLIDWDTATVPNAGYDLLAVATYPNGASSGPSSLVGVTVTNPGPTVVVPANNSTVSGSQWLDCRISSSLSGPVQFGVFSDGFPQVLGTATASEYGWLYDWNTASIANGTYSLYCSATYPNDEMGMGNGISVTVAN